MRTLAIQEMDCVSGGVDFTIELGPITVEFTGSELGDAYDWAVHQMSDFFTWWDPMGYYDRC